MIKFIFLTIDSRKIICSRFLTITTFLHVLFWMWFVIYDVSFSLLKWFKSLSQRLHIIREQLILIMIFSEKWFYVVVFLSVSHRIIFFRILIVIVSLSRYSSIVKQCFSMIASDITLKFNFFYKFFRKLRSFEIENIAVEK